MQRILVVDDNDVNRLLAVLSLGNDGRVVDEAPGGAQALALLAANRYDCVLLDISMPEMNGYEVCRRIREDATLAGLRVIAYTAHALDSEHRRILDSGFDGVLTKPVDIDAFETVISA